MLAWELKALSREGEQVMIDDEHVRYEALCARCYLEAEQPGS